jgi:quercetin dioxygenase-like cupin family protein
VPALGYVLKGKVRMHTKTGHEDYEQGQAFYWSPGHAPEMLEDCEYVDFSPAAELDAVIQHILNPQGS